MSNPISNINGLFGDANSTTIKPKEDKMKLDPMEFITLLVTQMRNQDPMNPMDGNTMLQQMSLLSSVQNTLTLGDTLTEFQNTQKMASAQSYLGHEVVIKDSESGKEITGMVSALIGLGTPECKVVVKDQAYLAKDVTEVHIKS